tara:strand:- start:159 stop:434 length:276 start_codon:yes stop_codon:yes gene_type:complete
MRWSCAALMSGLLPLLAAIKQRKMARRGRKRRRRGRVWKGTRITKMAMMSRVDRGEVLVRLLLVAPAPLTVATGARKRSTPRPRRSQIHPT